MGHVWLQLTDRESHQAELIIKHAGALFAALFLLIVYRCPVAYFLHVPCPGCGVTRAYKAALALHFKEAFRYHPLFPVVLPAVMYVAHRNVLIKRLSDKTEVMLFSGILAAFVVMYGIRIRHGEVAFLVA